MKRIAVLSDIHGNIEALHAVVNDTRFQNADCVVNLGDLVSGPLWPKETLDYLRQQDWIHIAGNHERELVTKNPEDLIPSDSYAQESLGDDDLDWLRLLPSRVELDDDILLFHGCPLIDTTYLLETIENKRVRLATNNEINKKLDSKKFPLMLCGHSHVPRIISLSGKYLIVNPGSVGVQTFDDTNGGLHVVENGSPHARYALIEHQGGDWRVECIAIPYDHRKAAQQARKNGRRDWEIALLTGYADYG